jgi:general secretion pathway protein D
LLSGAILLPCLQCDKSRQTVGKLKRLANTPVFVLRSAMKRLQRLGSIILIALFVAIPAIADKAKDFYEKGRDAEARQNYESAYDNFKQAYDLKPKELRYRVAFERTRFLAAASHVHRGQLLRDSGKLLDALKEFETAISIDSSSFIAQQEAVRTRQMIKEAQGARFEPPKEQKVSQRLSEAAGPVELAPISNQPITIQSTEDAKVIYETLGKLAGINVLFDPDYATSSRRIKISLNGVTLNQALEIASLESKTFWRPVTPNTIFVAADTQAKRKELEQSVIRTFYLSNLSTPTEIQDVTNTLRQILEITRVQQLPSQGAIIVRGTPDQIALAEKVINDIDKARPEVVVEVAVLQVQKDKLHQIGIQYPFSQTDNPTITFQPKGGTTTTTGGTTGTPSTTTSSGLTLNDLANLDARNFAISIPSSSLHLLMNDSSTKTIENPQIRALDGQKAQLKIGSRVPVATGSFQPGIGGVGINPLVNTQFQYLDVGVNIDMTPTVHADREVTLKLMLEISAVTGTSNIGGISQPIIGSRHIEHVIRLKEGEVNLLGGIMESSDVRSVSGLPGLAQIPVLKYLFGNNSKEVTDNEIVFAILPHIVRGSNVSDMNRRAIDVGTANAIELRREPAQQQATPAQAPANRAPEGHQLQQETPPAAAPPQAAVSAPNMGAQGAGAVLSFDPPNISQAPGTTFAVNVTLTGAQNAYSVPVQVNYDPKTLELVNVSGGSFLGKDGQAVAVVNRNDSMTGTLQVTASRPPGTGGVSGDGPVFTLTFMAKAAGQSNLTISRAQLRDPAMQAMPASGSQAVVNVK